ncbi:hypothetical protein ECANGB1_43 [Enterospora canceri]|uniref:Uncharacterized protein n=1 Tax=Enterospora canceri TaxID=1081671 RepID=A0A1Y1S8K6_9MICR|nr:hypothetical protein ECANGB1_43 [Enterospora canceri]
MPQKNTARFYSETNGLVKAIDFLLIKRGLFEYLINHSTEGGTTVAYGLINMLSLFSLSRIHFELLYFSGFALHMPQPTLMLLIKVYLINFAIFTTAILIHNRNSGKISLNLSRIIHAYALAHCYGSFYLLFVIWEYTTLFYFFALDFLVSCSLLLAAEILTGTKSLAYLLILMMSLVKYAFLVRKYTRV